MALGAFFGELHGKRSLNRMPDLWFATGVAGSLSFSSQSWKSE